MQILAFEPITGAITAFILQRMVTTTPSRIIPHGRKFIRRHKELLHESVISEVSDPLVNALSSTNIHILILCAIMLLILWRHHHHRLCK